MRCAILDVLTALLAPSYHNVLRFQCFDASLINGGHSLSDRCDRGNASTRLLTVLLDRFQEISGDDGSHSLARRVIRLVGISTVGGINESEMKYILEQANTSEALSLCWLQALDIMFQSFRNGENINEGPSEFFNFGGRDSGIFSVLRPFPFNKEYQIFAWFRLEGRRHDRSVSSETNGQLRTPTKNSYCPDIRKSVDTKESLNRQSLFCMNSSESSVDICVENNVLTVYICDCRNAEVTSIALKNFPVSCVGLHNQEWYHVCVKHTRPTGLNFFGSDELTVSLNFKPACQVNVRFPTSSGHTLTELSVGKNFQGQIGPVTVCADGLSQTAIDFIAQHEKIQTTELKEDQKLSGKLQLSASGNPSTPSLYVDTHRQPERFPDLLQNLISDRKSHPVANKIISSFHPARCAYGHVIDIHGGRHSRIAPLTFRSKVAHPHTVLESIGGMAALLPLFPNLLIEVDGDDDTDSLPSVKSGSSAVTRPAIKGPTKSIDLNAVSLNQWMLQLKGTLTLSSLADEAAREHVLSGETLSSLSSQLFAKLDCVTNIGLLFRLLSQCISVHRPFEKDLVRAGAISMIEYVLQQVPVEVFSVPAWTRACILGTIELRESTDIHSPLRSQITSSLICNFNIWSRANNDLQVAIAAVVLKDVETYGSDFYVAHVGVQSLLDAVTVHYLDAEISSYDSEPPSSEYVNDFEDTSVSLMHPQNVYKTPLTISVDAEESACDMTPSTIRLLDEITCNTPHMKNAQQTLFETPPASIPARRRRSTFKEKLSFVRRKSKPASDALLAVTDETADEDSQTYLDPSCMVTPQKFSLTGRRRQLEGDTPTMGTDGQSQAFLGTAVGSSAWGSSSTTSADEGSTRTDVSTPTAAISGPPNGTDDGTNTDTPGHEWMRCGIKESSKLDGIIAEGIGNEKMDGRGNQQPDCFTGADTHVDSSPAQEGTVPAVSDSTPGSTMAFPQHLLPHKRTVRGLFRSIMLHLITHAGNGANESKALILFTMFCRDSVVLEEMAQLVLTLVVESNERVLVAIAETFMGVEEFASLILLRLVSHKNEEIRCLGIRILTHFYLRVELLPANVINLNSRKYRNNVLSRALDMLASTSDRDVEMRRFQACGGLTLLVNYVILYIHNCTDKTHAALLEMLLTKPGNNSQLRIHTHNWLASVPDVSMLKDVQNIIHQHKYRYMKVVDNDISPEFTAVVDKTAVFSGLGIRIDAVHDDESDAINAIVLPTFFYMIPLFPSSFRDRVVSDLLGLLRSSVANQAAFCSMPQWHVCMYSLVSQFVDSHRDTSQRTIISKNNIMSYLMLTATVDVSNWLALPDTTLGGAAGSESGSDASRSRALATGTTAGNAESDMWFSLGMNVYAALLKNILNEKDGWWEVMVTISQAWTADTLRRKQLLSEQVDSEDLNAGKYVSQTILSHLVSEMAFAMHKTYANLKVNIKSKNSKKSKDAASKLENILFVLTLAAEFALGDMCASTKRVPNLKVARARVGILSKAMEEKAANQSASLTASERVSSPMHPPRSPMQHRNIELTVLATAERILANDLKDELPEKIISSGAVDRILTDFSHRWYSLPRGKLDVPIEQFVGTNSVILPEGTTQEQLRKKFARSPIYCGDGLHPLERDLTSKDGSLVLALQALRLFDAVFWPDDNLEIRNPGLLKIKRYPASLLAASTIKAEANPAFRGQTGLTLFGTMIRTSLFVLTYLSPINDLATLNALRLGYLIRAAANQSDVPHQSTPMVDWLLAVVVHVTLSLQRVVLTLGPVFRALGLDTPDLCVYSAGYPTPDEEVRLVEVQLRDATFFDAHQQCDEVGLESASALFDGVGGKNLIRFVKCCFKILIFIMEESWMQQILERSLDSRDYELLSQMVDRVARSCKSLVTVSAVAAKSKKSGGEGSSRSLSTADDLVAEASEVTEGRKRSDSVDSDHSDSTDGNPGNVPDKLPSTPAVVPVQNEAANAVFALSLMTVLLHMRDPFLRTVNICRSITVVLSLNALENIERGSCALFYSDLETARRSMLSQTVNPSNAYADESKALKSLSASALGAASVKERSRVVACRAKEESHIKRAAFNWTVCLHSAESGAISMSTEASGQHPPLSSTPEVQHEFTRSCDTRLRRMISTVALDPKDHSDDSYFEVRQRENQLHLDAMKQLGRDDASNGALANLSKSVGKMHWLKDAHNNVKDELWGGMESDDNASDTDETKSIDSKEGSVIWNRGAEFMGIEALLQNSEVIKRPLWSQQFNWAADEKILFHTSNVISIKLDFRVRGELILSNKYVYFHPRELVGGHGNKSEAEYLDERWPLDSVSEIFIRRYLQRPSALELFFVGSLEVLLAFASTKLAKRFWQFIRSHVLSVVSPVAQYMASSLVPYQVMYAAPWTDLWRRRLISNYEYLMRINIIAGRSFNDVSQYPVFPWVVADYTSNALDLHNPATFRDLSKPMGALDKDRLNYFLERYNSFETDSPLGPPFMYGSHYSTEGYVVYYMIRQEPFTTLGVNLQEGKFDCPDRLFFDVQRTWEGCSKQSVSDVKELIPEFYTSPEIFLNNNHWPLGELQEGGQINDVILPPWAANAYEFVRLNREALESEYVSAHLQDWIDLIFGYKQTGPAAADSHNVFHYLTYENAVDIDGIEDEEQKRAVQAQVTHYGQTPFQVFRKPHVKRLPKEECLVPLCPDASLLGIGNLTVFTPKQQFQLAPAGSSQATPQQSTPIKCPIINVRCSHERLVTCNSQFSINVYKWSSLTDADGVPFQLKNITDRVKALPSSHYLMSEETLQQLSFVPLIPSYLRKRTLGDEGQQLNDTDTTQKSQKKRSSQIYKAPSNSSLEADDSDAVIKSDGATRLADAQSPAASSDNASSSSPSVPPTPVPTPALGSPPPIATVSPLRLSLEIDKLACLADPAAGPNENLERSSGKGSPLFTSTTDSPTAGNSKRPLISLFGAIRKGISDFTDAASGNSARADDAGAGVPGVTPRLSRSDSISALLGRTTSTNATLSAPSAPTGLPQKATVGAPKVAFGLDEILFSDSSLAAGAVDRSVAHDLSPMSGRNVSVNVDKEGTGRVVSCGYWDNALKVHALDSTKEIASVNNRHWGSISCIATGHQNGRIIITGSSDCTCRVWVLEWSGLAHACSGSSNQHQLYHPHHSTNAGVSSSSSSSNLSVGRGSTVGASSLDSESLICLHILRGHHDPVSAVNYCSELDLVLSGDSAGILCLHTARKGKFIRRLPPCVNATGRPSQSVDHVLVSPAGYLVSYSGGNQCLSVFWVNGQQLKSVVESET
jgi:hypothetical protein